MLDFVPDSHLGARERQDDDDIIYCKVCGYEITRRGWAISVRDAYDHTVFNPTGRLFCVLCFEQAAGVTALGAASTAFTWFPGYAWRIAYCQSCSGHMGWVYEGDGSPNRFFGLIKASLVGV